jgi:sec-independent protein translocase protein TatA
MFELSVTKLILVALVVLVLFGRGKVADFMGEFGKGIKSFKQGLNDDEGHTKPAPPAQIPPPDAVPSASAKETTQAGQP